MAFPKLMYRRPKYVDKDAFRQRLHSFAESDKSGFSKYAVSSTKSTVPGIPENLAFERIVEDATCPPCTKRDFMNYLTYIEHAAENLQFYIWYKSYIERFQDAPKSDVALAPPWTRAMEEEALARMQHETREKHRPQPAGAQIFEGTDFEKPPKTTASVSISLPENPFSTPPRTATSDNTSVLGSTNRSVTTNTSTCRSHASEAFASANAKTPFTIQPFREEIDRIITTYIMDSAPRQLNLSAREQKTTLQALAYTTHPSAFKMAVNAIETSLRQQAHPNFIRWTICNGNPARVAFARGLGVSLTTIGFIVAILITLSHADRGWRALAAIAWALGISTLVAAYKGMCVVLHGLHHRHVRPWELFVDEDEAAEQHGRSFDSFGPSNSYEEEPWVAKYEKRNVIRKIFDREVWIKEPALKQIQDAIFIQSILSALLASGILTGIFLVVPGGDLY